MKHVFLTLLAGVTLVLAAEKKEFPAHWGQQPQIQTQDYGDLPGGYGKGSSTLRNWINGNLQKDKLAQADGTKPAPAAKKKEFPAHWGQPPQIQTRDFVDLPGDYGKGSSTMRNWINANLAKDKLAPAAGGKPAAAPVAKAIYAQDFEQTEVDKVPDGMLVLDGGFAVKQAGGGKVLELPGDPLETFGILFGPTEKDGLCVSARIHGTGKGRRFPVLAVGLSGVGGYKLQVSPAKKALELYRGEDMKTAVPFEWQSGKWAQFKFQVRPAKPGEWQVEGKVWAEGTAEPSAWQINFTETTAPTPGRPSIWGLPFSGTAIQFDDLTVTAVK